MATAGVDFAEQRLERVAGAEGELRERLPLRPTSTGASAGACGGCRVA